MKIRPNPVTPSIPAKTAVQVISCKSWCEIVYKGRRGFIYKSFVRHD